MKKRFPAAILALVLCMGLAVLPAEAQTLGQAYVPDSVELSTGYITGTAYQAGGALAAARGSVVLTGANLKLYNRLKEEVTKVANGQRDSSEFKIDTNGMGISFSRGALRGADINAIVRALLVDCPYELYWFDKVSGYSCGNQYNSGSGAVSAMTFQFAVSQDYAVANPAEMIYYRYRPDTKKTSAAAAVVKNAQAVVEQNSGHSDYDKLTAYRDYICGQVSYNYAAASSSTYPYGDPWQLVYVFDNDPDTNVVCEGYTKAFKYLCDMTSFSNQVECYIVSGRTSGDHMWNLVRINGNSYLADVTNSDTGNSGEYGGLFLAGAPNATGNGYTVNMPRHELGGGSYVPARSMSYTYDGETKALYNSDILTLAGSDYDGTADTPPADEPPVNEPPVNEPPVDTPPVDEPPVDTPPADEPPASTPAFTDVPEWCAPAVNWAAASGITQGTGNGKFSPDRDCTHVQILTFLWRAADQPISTATAFSGLAGDYAPAANWAYEKGMIDDSFAPQAPCTRAQAVTYIWQAFGTPEGGNGGFSDVDAGADYAAAVAWAVENGITNGYASGDGSFSFRPNTVCNRGVIATLLQRAYVPSARLK